MQWVRRFSPKEAARRLVAAPWLASDWPYAQVGIENHLNYIYRRSTPLTVAEARGLAAIGEQMNERNSEVDALVTAALVAADYLPDDFPLIQDVQEICQ